MPQKSKKQTSAVKPAAAPHGKVLVSWSFPEYPIYQRSVGWYLGMGLLGGFLVLYAVFTANFLFAVIIVLVALIIFVHSSNKPEIVNFEMTEDGIGLGESFYSHKNIKNFWLVYEPPEVKKLYFEFKSGWRPHLSVPLGNQDPVRLRKTLLQYLTEDLSRQHEPFSDQLGRLFKL